MFPIIIAMTFSLSIMAGEEWWSLSRTEDEKNIYYVGISEGKEKVPELQDKAFNKAMGELIREHFGMSIQINESAVEELNKQQFHVITKQSSAPLFIKGVKIVKTKEKDVDEGTRVYVQIQADKKTLSESTRNQLAQPGNDALNTYGETHDPNHSKIDIKVKTHPQGALIHFGSLDRRFSLQGQGDARFFLPRGRYQMVVSSPGFSTVSKEIELREQGIEESVILEELNGAVDLQVFPDEARITYHGNKIYPGVHKIPVGKNQKFKFEHPDYFPQEIEFMIKEPETVTKVIKLEPKPSTIALDIYPRNASVFVDGRQTSIHDGKIEVEPGRREITVTAPGYFSRSEKVYVSSNREYPLKIIRLLVDDVNTSPSDKQLTFRFELNPFAMVDQVGFGQAGGAIYLEYYYISLGYGINWTNYTKEREDKMPQDEVGMSDNYATLRLITPKLGPLKFFASGTYGQFKRNQETNDHRTIWSLTKKYQGVGGGFRLFIKPKWSLHAEYFKVNVEDQETHIKTKQDRVIMGLSYEF